MFSQQESARHGLSQHRPPGRPTPPRSCRQQLHDTNIRAARYSPVDGFVRGLTLTVQRARGGTIPRASSDVASVGLFGGEDFYTILGVTPSAEPRDIKRAYHSLMREFHPDRAPEGLRDGMADLCVLLNEIYATLSDEEKRCVYDSIAGFSSSAINPFLDGSFARDQVFVDEISCIGCGKCVRACPMTFEIEDSKYGRARVISQTSDSVEDVQIAIECCPVDCIHYVTLPQLSLLEAALGTMSRIEVSTMQRFGRSGGNVFEVAYKAWERRMAAIEQRAAAAAAAAGGGKARVDWSFWTNGASLQYDEQAEERAAVMDPEQRRIANLAASAARAARMWRLYSRSTGGRSLLSESSSGSSMGSGSSMASMSEL
ncbi:hypothetical protein CHLRE_02g104500v5 [Chlamydomonas reinhardtii]|nr:uncharacterized protein CHLRE_02g104500v5 [Chlamydomonas reinhardtii]PNW86995.1 hypothetical protein CHLRE_02g104500v5 [Chlamydomonas reinhardtii]